MNANQIYPGEEYAVAPYKKPNGNVFVPNAIRFMAMRTFGKQEYGNKRLTMYVEGFRLNRETGEPLSTDYVTFRARDVIEDWDEYQDRADQHEVELQKIRRGQEARWEEQRRRREKERQEYELQRKEREIRAQEERTRKFERKQRILQNLADRGFDPDQVVYDDVVGRVSIRIEDLEAWLNSLDKYECMQCGLEIMRIPLPRKDSVSG